ncbi:MAG: GTPase HflX [Acidimicrobiia bacterium]|nr:GTPase HflX [Acidimicrobiia bacterium]
MTTGRGGRRLTATVTDLEVVEQRAYLIGVATSSARTESAERSLAELGRLTETAGSEPVFTELLTRAELEPGLLIGKGQAKRAVELSKTLDIDVVVFDNSLSPAQQRNLQSMFECDVVDRQAVILDIFAQHASSRAGMLQVELALLEYYLPRLRGKGVELSRQAGGIGTRGPGETKLETDRRRILQRISRLKRELKEVAATRHTQRKARIRSKLPVVALVGYTNAGKSTLLNQITDADVLVEDQLFSTLDSSVRRAELPGGTPSLFSDTVGFIRDLPHQLIEAFQSTLDEVHNADLLLHVVDGSDPDADTQITAVRSVLGEIGAEQVPELFVINKVDRANPQAIQRLVAMHDGVAVSASTGAGVPALLDVIERDLTATAYRVTLEIPYERGDLLALLHRNGAVIEESHTEAGTLVDARLRGDMATRFEPWLVE